MTVSEKLLALVAAAWRHNLALGPVALAINAGLSVLAVAVCWAAAWGLRRLVSYGSAHIPAIGSRKTQQRARTALGMTGAFVSLAGAVLALLLVAGIWGFDVLGWIARGMGERLTHTLLTVVIVLIVTVLAFEIAGAIISYLLNRLKTREGVDLRRVAQFDTLGPILRRTCQATILVIGAMTFLSQVGVQIAPLLAGAGVVGIAVGFGAQTLVKDFFTGFFLLIEDVVAVGDVVTIGPSTGEVEDMTLRYISLRDFDGTLHVFPYGEAQVVHNQTKTFSYFVFELPVTYGADIDKALDLTRSVGEQLCQDAHFKDLILAPLDMAGVDLLSDIGVVIKARIKTLPRERWRVGREFNRRIKIAFDEAGIAITHK